MRCARLWIVALTLFTPLVAIDCSGGGYAAGPKEYCVNGKKDRNEGETGVDCGGKCSPCDLGGWCNEAKDCASGLVCLPNPFAASAEHPEERNACQPSHCGDDKRNDDESDVDCGGSCLDCAAGQRCKASGDCESNVCNEGLCSAATCLDGVRNQDESDIDCGSQLTACDKCGAGKSCTVDLQCDSGVCDSGKCAQASCKDGNKNGDEGGVDCGGSCPTRCGQDSPCNKDADCGSNVCRNNVCLGALCGDGVQNGTESDVDCGGVCGATCIDTAGCNSDGDCLHGFCSNHVCAKPTCDDGIKNQGESDIDCGDAALVCPRCTPGKVCLYASGCDSLNCLDSRCVTRTCDDLIKNGLEGDVDCGGDCPMKCPVGGTCRQMTDCAEGVCTDNRCSDDSCADGVRNGQETDVDCGGPTCPNRCEIGLKCQMHADCKINSCAAGICADPLCTNAMLDGTESDVDCGGDRCGKCVETKKCKRNEDCLSQNCVNLICAPASCTDRIQNGRETFVDCGGDCAKKCEVGQTCAVGTDCRYGVCSGGVCKAAACDDLVKNDLETDTDCGGAACTALATPRLCAKGQGCVDDSDCRAKLICDAATGKCTDWSCTDQRKNQDETDVDCGGTICGGCATGKVCKINGDCRDSRCNLTTLRCDTPSCSDGVKNGAEGDKDCGGNCSTKCPAEAFCNVGSDCISGVCSATNPKTCAPPACGDGVQNGSETDVDCGGSITACATRCGDGKVCKVQSDCLPSTTCTPNGSYSVCRAPGCDNGDWDQSNKETDVDCGGPNCSKCGVSKKCLVDSDCTPIASGKCSTAKVCAPASCNDLAQNGAESDVDCGGTDPSGTYPSCNRCADGKMCSIPSDCTSKSCNGTCLAPTCADGIQNGSEAGVDCGSACASFGKLCPNDAPCKADGDCTSGWCNAGVCGARSCTDGIQNGAESDKDCGAICGLASQLCKAASGQKCKIDADCDSATCSECTGKCINAKELCYAQPATLTTCAQCAEAQACSQDFDCKSLNCDQTTKTCVAADNCPGRVLAAGSCTENCKTVLRCLFANNCKLGDACATSSGICGSNTLRFDMSPYDAAKSAMMAVCTASGTPSLSAYCNTSTTCK